MQYTKLFFISACLLLTVAAQGQDKAAYQRSYQNGKGLFDLGKYEMAMEAFKPLTKQEAGNPFTEYASFYYALSAYKAGQEGVAKAMLLQINQKYPNWEKADDVYYWLTKVYFDMGAYDQGIKTSHKIKNQKVKEDVEGMKLHYLGQVSDIKMLKDLLQQNPYDLEVAKVLAREVSERPATGENSQLLDFLINEFELDKEKYEALGLEKSEKKAHYNVAVLFPFMTEELKEGRSVHPNQFVLDTYEGIRIAVEKLNAEGKKINLYAYDTKRDSAATAKILNRPELRQMDLIIGPLYPVTSRLASEFTYKYKINMLNPLSSNAAVIGGNPMSFLFKPTLETQAIAAATYASEAFKDNPKTMIVYGKTAQDSILAFTYRKIAEEKGLEVEHMKRVGEEEARDLLQFLTKKASEDDSLSYNPGHVFVATTNEMVVANVISALEIRADKLPVITLEDWLNLKFISFEQLSRLKIRFIAPNYINYDKEEIAAFQEVFKEETHALPTPYAYTGYDMMLFFGNMLLEYGNYFQQGFVNEGFNKGSIYTGYVYRGNNDNQFVPIVQFNGPTLKLLNASAEVSKLLGLDEVKEEDSTSE